MHPADAADIIEHLSQDDRENLIKLNNFKLDPELFVELNENIQSEIIKLLSTASIIFILNIYLLYSCIKGANINVVSA